MINTASRDWLLVEELINERLAKHRTTLESVQVDERSTQVLRGRIAELKALVDCVKPRPVKRTALDPLGQHD